MGALVAVMTVYSSNDTFASVSLTVLCSVFILMRLVQPVLNYLLFRSAKDQENKQKRIIALGSLATLFILSQVIIILSVSGIPAQMNRIVYQSLVYCTLMELLLWDTLMMPVILGVIAYRCNK